MWCWQESIGWWTTFGGIWMIMFWAVVVGLIVWGISRLTERRGSASATIERRIPLEIAKQRYARGEISREEFEQFKKDLS